MINRRRTSLSRLNDFAELVKPGIVLWVLITVAAGFVLASGSVLGDMALFHVLLGAALVAGGSNALNQVVERDTDARMPRTAARPLPAGRLSVGAATWFGVILGVSGVVYIAVFTTPITTLCAAATLGLYVLVYTPLKRRTSLATLVGALPGALPILGGWAASGRGVEPMAWTLFAILFLWQLPHFLALAWVYREEYAAAGLKMLGAHGGDATFRQALLYGMALLPVSLLPTLLGAAGSLYFFGAIALCLWLLWTIVAVLRDPAKRKAWRLFSASVVYLPAVLALMVIDRVG